MILEDGLEALRRCPPGAVMSIGNFDGVHVGHRSIIDLARSLREPGRELVVVTFEPHPLTVLRPHLAPPRIGSVQRKRETLAELGVDRLITIAPAPDVLNTTATDFFAILRDEAKVHHLVEGRNFSFGKARVGNVERLREWCAGADIHLTIAPQVEVQLSDLTLVPCSSSLVRWLIAKGRVRDAAQCLSRPYVLEGKVVSGEQRGRTIGFPTANLDCGDQLLPADGVYAARTTIDSKSYAVALSIGTKPTFHAEVEVAVEGYILDFNGDLYGRELRMEVLAWIRDQTRFPSVESLIEQLQRDVTEVRSAGKQLPASWFAGKMGK